MACVCAPSTIQYSLYLIGSQLVLSACGAPSSIIRYTCSDKNAPSTGTERVDRVMCGNPRISHHDCDVLDLPAKWRMHSSTLLYNPISMVVHEVWQRSPTTRKFTATLTFLYCGTSARLAFALHESTTIMC